MYIYTHIGNENRANYQAGYKINECWDPILWKKENLNDRGRTSCENSFVLTKPKLHNENATLRILLCDSQSDLHVIYCKTPDEDCPTIVEMLGIK